MPFPAASRFADHGRPDRPQLRALFEKMGVLEKFDVEMIGASASAIDMARIANFSAKP